MFCRRNDDGYRQALPGVAMKTLVFGDKMLLVEFRLLAGHVLPRHAHEQEQTGYLVSGAIRLLVGEETVDLAPGDAWSIPANVEHAATIIADSVAVEVFSPVRQDYLADA